jgi:hypothetical protein
MTKHLLLYIGLSALAFGAILFGSYNLLPHWFPSVLGSESHLDTDSQLAILILLSGATASCVTAVLAGATSVFSALYQIRALRDLEVHKGSVLEKIEDVRASAAQRLEVQRGDILDKVETKKAKSVEELEGIRKDSAKELEGIKSAYSAELENTKNSFASQLDAKRQQLADELSLERLRIEQSHRNLDALLKAVSEYRVAVSSLGTGTFNSDLANECAKRLKMAMDFVSSNSALYHALESFRQRGVYIIDRAKRLSSEEQYRKLWSESPGGESRALGVAFGADAENVKALLIAEDERALRGH